MRIFKIFVFFLILFHSVAYAYDNPVLIKSIEGNVINQGTVTIDSDYLQWVEINFTTPQNTNNQKATYSRNTTTDIFGNTVIKIREDEPTNTVNYKFTTGFLVNEQKTRELPETYTIPEDVKEYLNATENIQSNDSRIINLAREITNDSKTDFEKVAKIAIWINENLEYEEKLGTDAKDAIWVLDNKIGTCDEYTTLFVALTRANEIPARYVYGYAYNEKWQKHAWAEVYLGKWVPVDSLWLEVGNLDATHVNFGKTTDNIVKNQVKAFGLKIEDIEWEGEKENIEVTNIEYSLPLEGYSLYIGQESISPGDDINIYFKFKPDNYDVLDLRLETCYDPTIQLAQIRDKKKYVILEPDKEVIISWNASVSDNLIQNSKYVCPLTLNSKYLKTKSVNLVVDTTEKVKTFEKESLIDRIMDFITKLFGVFNE